MIVTGERVNVALMSAFAGGSFLSLDTRKHTHSWFLHSSAVTPATPTRLLSQLPGLRVSTPWGCLKQPSTLCCNLHGGPRVGSSYRGENKGWMWVRDSLVSSGGWIPIHHPFYGQSGQPPNTSQGVC